MKEGIRLFFWVLIISFLGTLPLGTLNISITNLVLHKGIRDAVLFAVGAILVEVSIVRMAVFAIGKAEKMQRYFKLFSWASLAILFSLSIITLIAAIQMKKFEATLPFTGTNPFLSGVLLSALNPLHLPFWLGWTAVLKSKGILTATPSSYNIYMTGIGLGTSVAFWLYGYAGAIVIQLLNDKQYIINWLVGLSLLITAIVQSVRLGKKKPAPLVTIS